MFPSARTAVRTSQFKVILLALAAAASFLSRPVLAVGADKPAAALLPASTLAYFEISRPKDLIALLSDHPLVHQIEQSPDFRKAKESEKFKQFFTAVEIFERRSSLKWRPALEAVTGGGIVVAVDPSTRGLIVLVKSEDAKTADSVREALMSMARDDAASKGNPDPVESKDYRGLTAWKVGDGYVANLGPWMLFSNSADAAKAVGDKFLDGGAALSDEKEFTDARGLALPGGRDSDGPAAWGYVRLAPLRMMGAASKLIDNKEKSDNPALELLLGGVIANLRNSPYVTASLYLNKHDVKLSLASPNDPASIPAERKFFFAPEGGGADAPLKPKDTLLSLSTYRDLSAFWQAAPDLFDEGVAAKIAQSDSGLSTFLGGKSFSTDVLGALRPEIQFVATRQDFKGQGMHKPAIELPAFATVFRVKPGEAKTVRKAFRLAFQSLVTFANLDAASKNRPTLETSSETRSGSEVVFATYDADDAPAKVAPGSGAKPAAKAGEDTYYNFSPALVLSDDYLIVCSTRQIAEDLADLIAKRGEAESGSEFRATNTVVAADGAGIAELLREDREQLIAQNMLEKGHDRPAAEHEIDLFIGIVQSVKASQLRLLQSGKSIRLEIELTSDAR